MNTLEALRRELQSQAEETAEWPAPRLRARPRTSRLRGPVLVLASTLIVLSVLIATPLVLGPGDRLQGHEPTGSAGSGRGDGSHPTDAPYQPLVRGTVTGPSDRFSHVTVGGVRYHAIGFPATGRIGPRPSNLIESYYGRYLRGWILVGAFSTTPESRLRLTLRGGDRTRTRSIPTERFSWLRLPARTYVVTLEDTVVPPDQGETLFVQRYYRDVN